MESTLIVILNWNELNLTSRCLTSLMPGMEDNYDILLIDNDSENDPSDFFANKYPNITIIKNDKNFGVAGGRNVGIRYAIDNNYEFVFLFDNDAYGDSKLIELLLSAAQKYPDTALFGPKIYMDVSNHKNIWRAGCTSWKWTYLHAGHEILIRFCRLLKKRPPSWIDTGRGENQKDMGQYDQVRDIPFQIGCAQLIRTVVFKEVGLLDLDFSPYGSEDINFCARLSKKNWKIKYIPDAICWHRVGSSFRDNYNRSFFNTRNIILLARKNLHPLYFTFLFMPDFILLTIPLISIESLFFRQKNRIKGFFDGIVWNFKDIVKRGILLKDKYN